MRVFETFDLGCFKILMVGHSFFTQILVYVFRLSFDLLDYFYITHLVPKCLTERSVVNAKGISEVEESDT